jgi:hypothetical protein
MWTPLLTDHEADQARGIVLRIADAVAVENDAHDEMRPLLDAYLAKALQSEKHLDRALNRLELQYQRPRSHTALGLFSGVPGLGWVTSHLHALLADWLDLDDEDPCDAIDEALLRAVRSYPSGGQYDLVSGLAGFAIYALERPRGGDADVVLNEALHRLSENAERSADRIRWLTPPELLPPQQLASAPNGYYNLGVAHGVPALTLVFARSMRAGIASGLAAELIEGAVSWIAGQRVAYGYGSRFPSWTTVGAAREDVGAREAWCYGGLGLSVTLLAAAREARRDDWERLAVDYARLEAVRPTEHSGVIDMCLCHGGAGNAHLYNRLFQATGEPVFQAAALKWLRATLAAFDPSLDDCGYLFYKPRTPGGANGYLPDSNFLTGAAGVALALLAATSDVAPEWDRVMLADVPLNTPT